MDTQTFELAKQQAEICKVFGNANRVLILWVLGNQEMSVGAVARAIDSSLQNTSQHLRLMKDKGILVSRREGRTIYYRIGGYRLIQDCRILQRTIQEMPV
jgi:DNA-binding transcriptional ArsR family regulator